MELIEMSVMRSVAVGPDGRRRSVPSRIQILFLIFCQ
jgi:hypothetical protein